MIMNDEENRTPKPRCPSNYKLLLKLPWKNRCSYRGVRLWFCNNPCNLAVFEILPLQRDQIERDQALGDQTNGAPVQGDQVQEDLALKELLTNFLKVAMKKVMTNEKTMTTPKPRYSSNGGIFDRVMRFDWLLENMSVLWYFLLSLCMFLFYLYFVLYPALLLNLH